MTNDIGAWQERLYVVTFALLATHEIDSAYWHEWTMLGMPGGIQLFLVANFVLLIPFLFGLTRIARDPRAAAPFGLALSSAGVAAFAIHAWYLSQGRAEFRSVASIVILATILVASLALGWVSASIRLARPSA